MLDFSEKVTRFEVINHGDPEQRFGRLLTMYGVDIQLELQDQGRTLKVFIVGTKEYGG